MPATDEPDPRLLQFVDGNDVDCPGCGYNLRDLRTGRCPECGQQLQLTLRLAEPRQGALIAGVVGLASGFGLGGLMLIYGLIMLMRRFGPGGLHEFFVINGVGFAAHGLVLLLWVRHWNAIRRVGAAQRAWLVAACWAMPLAFIVIFAFRIR